MHEFAWHFNSQPSFDHIIDRTEGFRWPPLWLLVESVEQFHLSEVLDQMSIRWTRNLWMCWSSIEEFIVERILGLNRAFGRSIWGFLAFGSIWFYLSFCSCSASTKLQWFSGSKSRASTSNLQSFALTSLRNLPLPSAGPVFDPRLKQKFFFLYLQIPLLVRNFCRSP